MKRTWSMREASSIEELEEELRGCVEELDSIRGRYGGSLANVESEDADRIRELVKDADIIGRILEEKQAVGIRDVGGNRIPPPGGQFNRGGATPGPVGWRSGHWANAFVPKIGAAVTPSGSINVPRMLDGIVPLTDRPTRLLDVMPRNPLQGSDAYAYVRETVRTLAAAPVASGGTKPTSVISVAKVEDTARVIAHLGEPVDRFILSDATLLRSYLEGSFREGVFLGLESQIVVGTGIAPALLGITNTSGIQSVAFLTNLIITARKMATALENVDLPDVSAFYLMAPAQWEAIELATATGSGEFLLENSPVNLSARRLWGRPVIVSRACPTTHMFLIDRASVAVFERENVQIDWATQSSTLFETNMVKLRAEGRYGFAVMRPTGIVKSPTA